MRRAAARRREPTRDGPRRDGGAAARASTRRVPAGATCSDRSRSSPPPRRPRRRERGRSGGEAGDHRSNAVRSASVDKNHEDGGVRKYSDGPMRSGESPLPPMEALAQGLQALLADPDQPALRAVEVDHDHDHERHQDGEGERRGKAASPARPGRLPDGGHGDDGDREQQHQDDRRDVVPHRREALLVEIDHLVQGGEEERPERVGIRPGQRRRPRPHGVVEPLALGDGPLEVLGIADARGTLQADVDVAAEELGHLLSARHRRRAQVRGADRVRLVEHELLAGVEALRRHRVREREEEAEQPEHPGLEGARLGARALVGAGGTPACDAEAELVRRHEKGEEKEAGENVGRRREHGRSSGPASGAGQASCGSSLEFDTRHVFHYGASMTPHPARFWAGLLAALVLVLWLLRHILLPFVLGMAVGYLLDPLVDRLARRGIPRAAAAGVMVVAAYGASIGAVVLLAPVLVRQLVDLVTRVPAYARAAYEALSPLVQRLEAGPGSARVGELAAAAAQRATELVAPIAAGLIGRGLAVLNLVILLAITPLVAFYLLRDWPKLVTEVDGWLPREHADVIRAQARAIDAVLAGFARGTAIVGATLGLYYALALTIVRLESGLLIGLTAGAVSFVPYVGTLGGAGTAMGVAMYQFWPEWSRVAVVGGIFAVGQLLNDYVLTPNLVGDKVGLHPLWILFALFAGGALLGFAGVVIAVPVSAVIGVLARFAIGQYKESSLYRRPVHVVDRDRSRAP